jgi:hypothetical protein
MTMVAQRQRLLEAAGERREPAEMRDPLGLRQAVEPDALRPELVAITQDGLRKPGSLDGIEEVRAEIGVTARGMRGGQGLRAPAMALTTRSAGSAGPSTR